MGVLDTSMFDRRDFIELNEIKGNAGGFVGVGNIVGEGLVRWWIHNDKGKAQETVTFAF